MSFNSDVRTYARGPYAMGVMTIKVIKLNPESKIRAR